MRYRAKKSLGQNFLKSRAVLAKIVEAGEISAEDTILEIGPGKGALTEKLLECAGKVVAVEKDPDLCAYLKEKFAAEISTRKLELAQGDILDFEMPDLRGQTSQVRRGSKVAPFSRGYKIVANIPYNITGAILKKFLTAETDGEKEKRHRKKGGAELPRGGQPERMVLLVQKEVAKRIMARDGKESLLSLSVKAYGSPKIVIKVPAGNFSPVPKVDSAALVIKNISKKIFTENNIEEGLFWQTVRAGFAHKRKKLSGNLPKLREFPGNLGILSKLGDKRAEDLSLSDWILLAKAGI